LKASEDGNSLLLEGSGTEFLAKPSGLESTTQDMGCVEEMGDSVERTQEQSTVNMIDSRSLYGQSQ